MDLTLKEIEELQEVLNDLQKNLNLERKKAILRMLLDKLRKEEC